MLKNNLKSKMITLILLLFIIISLNGCENEKNAQLNSNNEELNMNNTDNNKLENENNNDLNSQNDEEFDEENNESDDKANTQDLVENNNSKLDSDDKYSFQGPISKEVLNNYLSRAVTHNGFASFAAYGDVPSGENPYFEEDFRMIKEIGAMFIGRAAHVWGIANEEEHYRIAKEKAQIVHEYDPRIILQACIFEAIYESNLEEITVPNWVFEEFDIPYEERKFSYEDMLFKDKAFVNRWGIGGSVPDITRVESQMWFFYRAARYIDSGYEAIHLGQLALIGRNDSDNLITAKLLERIRDYASENARRKWVILDAHVYEKRYAAYEKDGKDYLLLDFHSFPLRPRDNFEGNEVKEDGYQPTRLEENFIDAIYGKSAGGIHPAGWETEYNLFLCEFDNSGYNKEHKDKMLGQYWPWGYDEITWFSKQPEDRRAQILEEFYFYINDNYKYGNLQIPTRVPLAYQFVVSYGTNGYGPFDYKTHFFRANNQSLESVDSFNLEDKIKELWDKK